MFELKFRSQYSLALSAELGPFAHLEPSNYKDAGEYFASAGSYFREAGRKARGDTAVSKAIREHGNVPVWTAVECMSFGTLSKMYSNTRSRTVRKAVSDSFGVRHEYLTSWLKTLTDVRDECAHFGRVLGRNLTKPPKEMSVPGVANTNPLYVALVLMRLLRADRNFGKGSLLDSVNMLAEIAELFAANARLLPFCRVPDCWLSAVSCEEVHGFPVAWEFSKPPGGVATHTAHDGL